MSARKVNNSLLVTIAVAELGGENRFIHPEDIALRVDRLAPGKFRWKKYKDFVDIHLVKKALQDSKRKTGDEGEMLLGDNTKGWMLTPAGLNWYKQIGADLFKVGRQKEVVNRKESVQAELEADRTRMRKTNAFKLFEEGKTKEINLQDFQRFVRINEYFLSKARSRRFALVENAVSDDAELVSLWEYLKGTFDREMK